MEFELLFSPVLEIIRKFLNGLEVEILEGVFSLIVQFIKTPSNINTYLPIEDFLGYIQVLAGTLLVLKVTWEVFGQITGNISSVSGRSIGRFVLQTLWVASIIFLLPILVTGILIRINNYLVELVVSVGGASMDNYKKKRRPVKESLAKDLAEKLDDNYSLGFYRVVASLVLKNFIFQVLSDVGDTHITGKIKKVRQLCLV